MSSRTRLSFTVKSSSVGDTLNINIADPGKLEADNLALATWGSSQVLADLLHRLTHRPTSTSSPGIPVLELGAGTGLVGLTAAAVWKTEVVLTDLPPILPNIQSNVALNETLVTSGGGKVRCGTLDWAKPDKLTFTAGQGILEASSSKAEIILAADTVYSEEHPQLLTNAVQAWLGRTSSSRLVLCYPLRIGYLDHIRDLWERLEAAGLQSIEEGREQVDESWDEDVPYEWCIWKWQSI